VGADFLFSEISYRDLNLPFAEGDCNYCRNDGKA